MAEGSLNIEGLRDKINSAGAVGIRASISNDGTGSDPYRLILTANDSGSANTIYITQNDTDLDFANKQVEAAYANTSNTYTGTITSAGTYTGTTNKTFLIEAVTAGASATATYKYSIDGGVNWLGYDGSAYNAAASDDASGGAITTSTSTLTLFLYCRRFLTQQIRSFNSVC